MVYNWKSHYFRKRPPNGQGYSSACSPNSRRGWALGRKNARSGGSGCMIWPCSHITMTYKFSWVDAWLFYDLFRPNMAQKTWFTSGNSWQFSNTTGTHNRMKALKVIHVGLSENSAPHCTQWFMIIIPIKWLAIIGNINPTISDKPKSFMCDLVNFCHAAHGQFTWRRCPGFHSDDSKRSQFHVLTFLRYVDFDDSSLVFLKHLVTQLVKSYE